MLYFIRNLRSDYIFSKVFTNKEDALAEASRLNSLYRTKSIVVRTFEDIDAN